jgi:hypothetical protein
MTSEEILRIQELPSLIEKEKDPAMIKLMAMELENLLSKQLTEIRTRQIPRQEIASS